VAFLQVRQQLAILYRRFLCEQLGGARAATFAARQAKALSILKRLTQRGLHSQVAAVDNISTEHNPLNSLSLKGLSDEMDLTFDDMCD
jgi:hypothetical protein